MIGKVMAFNPFTGQPRRPEDIASDPAGVLVWDGEEPLRAVLAPTQPALNVVAYEVRAYNRTQRVVMREDVADELASNMRGQGWQDVEVRALVYHSRATDLRNALIAMDARLRECFGKPITAEDAYDSYFQQMVIDAIRGDNHG